MIIHYHWPVGFNISERIEPPGALCRWFDWNAVFTTVSSVNELSELVTFREALLAVGDR